MLTSQTKVFILFQVLQKWKKIMSNELKYKSDVKYENVVPNRE